MTSKKYHRRKFIVDAVFLCLLLGIPFVLAYSQYLPPPPPGEIRYTPQQSEQVIQPPPEGWSRTTPQKTFAPPIPPLDPKLKDFPIDLDLLDFAGRNPFSKEHCFFRVKGRKDIVEFLPDQQQGTFNFPTGHCNFEEDKCYVGARKGRLPGMAKTEPPIYQGFVESAHRGFPVIPYKYVDDIDFSACVPSWTGYFEPDNYKASQRTYLYEPPKRDYSKQSCYHPVRNPIVYPNNRASIFCDEERCQLTDNQYCENKTGQCYLNEYPLKTKKGQSVTTYEDYIGINWDFCTDKTGSLIPEDGGQPYEERFKAGCSYRIEAPNYHEKQYAGNINFLIHCDENRCWHQELNFDMKRKEYLENNGFDRQTYTKTPPFSEFLTINWQCLDATKVRDYNKKLLCTLVSSDEKNPDCRLCYENKKFVYKGCRVQYDELGRRADVPAELRDYSILEETRLLREIMPTLENDGEISWKTSKWFEAFAHMAEAYAYMIDEPQRHRLAFLVSKFRNLTNPKEKDVEKLQRQISPFLTDEMKKGIDEYIKDAREGMCTICNTSTAESRLSSPIRETCAACSSKF